MLMRWSSHEIITQAEILDFEGQQLELQGEPSALTILFYTILIISISPINRTPII